MLPLTFRVSHVTEMQYSVEVGFEDTDIGIKQCRFVIKFTHKRDPRDDDFYNGQLGIADAQSLAQAILEKWPLKDCSCKECQRS